jgi:CHAD domain-containing protein
MWRLPDFHTFAGIFRMVITIERGKLIFRKVDRELGRLAAEQNPETVHNFRTSARRLQTLLEQLLPARDRNQKKLLKALNRIRKSAGKVRDIDVQIFSLRSMRIPLEPRRKTQLLQGLLQARAKHESKLRKLLKKNEVRNLEKRLRRAAKQMSFEAAQGPLAVGRELLASAAVPPDSASEAALHRFRIAVKRARYAAEFAPVSAESKQFIGQLKRLQDALGHWHDWFTLTNTASDQLGDVTQSSLVAVLHNVTRAKFRQAVVAVSSVQKEAAAAPAARKSNVKSLARIHSAGAAA